MYEEVAEQQSECFWLLLRDEMPASFDRLATKVIGKRPQWTSHVGD